MGENEYDAYAVANEPLRLVQSQLFELQRSSSRSIDEDSGAGLHTSSAIRSLADSLAREVFGRDFRFWICLKSAVSFGVGSESENIGSLHNLQDKF